MSKLKFTCRSAAFLFCLVFFLVSGCATPRMQNPREFLKDYPLGEISPDAFKLCYQYGCPATLDVSLNREEWDDIKNLFQPAPENAAREREMLAEAIQKLEQVTGRKTGVNQDIGGTFPGIFKKGQMDCEDEAVNTAVFLSFLQDDQVLQFHHFYGIALRGPIPNGWPHMACAIEEIDSGARFVVDSWFLDHGMPIHIIPESDWKSGWKPPKE